MTNFPHYLIASLFCLLQIVLYILVFFPDIRQKLVGICVPVLAVIIIIVVSGGTSRIEMGYTSTLPDNPSLSAEAMISIDDTSVASVDFWDPEGGVIFVRTQTYGTATITVTDGGETYQYTLEIYREDGNAQVMITPVGQEGS